MRASKLPDHFDHNPTHDSRSEGTTNVSIPKIIMQTWKTQNVPLHWRASQESIRCQMPDWQYVLMTDKDNREFVKKHFPDFLPYYDRFEYPIQRADAVRYCWLAINGGIYMDLDIELLKPLDPLFISDNDVYLVSSGNLSSSITNSFMASKPGVKLWYDVIEEMKKPVSWWAIGKHWKVMNSTGPLMLNRVVKRGDAVYATLPTRTVMPCSVCDDVCMQPDAYVRPLPGQSWCAFDSMLYNFLLCRWRLVVFIVFILIVVIIVYLWTRLRWKWKR